MIFSSCLRWFPHMNYRSSAEYSGELSADFRYPLSLALCPVNSGCLGFPGAQLFFSSESLPGSTWAPSLHLAWKLSRQNAGETTGLVSPVSYRSRITSLLCPMSSKVLFHLFCLFFGCIRWESKSGPCYSSLGGSFL